jgi:hydroxymethylpyrimidine pyrophosphatase-like HAD family hydrolase
MRYLALACDYDGTVASDGVLDEPTRAALARVRASGRKLLLVTGRVLEDLGRVCPGLELFDAIVAENGAVIHRPDTRESRLLGAPPPAGFVAALRAAGVEDLGVGRVIVATRRPYETAALDVIRAQGLELNVVFNKGAVMVLPSGINKATGLAAALAELGLSAHNVVGIGDAENDHAFLSTCECAVAVANAIPSLKELADYVTAASRGAGASELAAMMLADDLASLAPRLHRHDLLLGHDGDGRAVTLPAHGATVLVAGTSGGGKSTVVTGLIERMAERGYQHCVVDPEGDYATYQGGVVLGDAEHAPTMHEVMDVLTAPDRNVVVNLLGVPLEQRPPFCTTLLTQLLELRARLGRPHWIILDEAHHMLPEGWQAPAPVDSRQLAGLVLVTVHPEHVVPSVLRSVDTVIALGREPAETLRRFAGALGLGAPSVDSGGLPAGEVLVWSPRTPAAEAVRLRATPARGERRRHARKYAEGELGPDRSFFFRGPDGRLNLRAQNLRLFLQVADGVDDQTWLFHLRRGDYSAWIRGAIKDDDVADEIAAVETGALGAPSPTETRARVRAAIEARYTAPP